MKWHLSEEEQQEIQKNDEEFFFGYFDKNGYNPRKLDESGIGRNPDYELCKNNIKVIIEIKSRFGDYEPDRTTTLITNALSRINIGFDYSLKHSYKNIPSSHIIKDKTNLIRQELDLLGENIILPYNLRLGDFRIENLYKDLMRKNPSAKDQYAQLMERHYFMPRDNDLAITIENKNDAGYLRCTTVSYGFNEDIGVKEKIYFTQSLKTARKQLESYIGNETIGILFFNHTHHGWDDLDIIRLYGNLVVSFSSDPKNDEAVIGIADDRILRENRRQWVSFIGIIDGHYRREFQIYRNGFASKLLDLDYFKLPECNIKTIKLSENGNSMTIE